MGIPFNDYDALGLAELVKKKEIKPIELVDEAIRMIERYNPNLNAVINRMYEQARQTAVKADINGLFAGVPECAYALNEGWTSLWCSIYRCAWKGRYIISIGQ